MSEEIDRSTPDGFVKRIEDAGGEVLPTEIDNIAAARVPADSLVDLLTSLRDGPGIAFGMLTDLCGVDEYKSSPRFDVVYHLRSLESGVMVRIKSFAVGDPPVIPSVVSVFSTADWHEREVFDMLGIQFDGHPDLKRILMPLEYEEFPLRKDFPLEGIEPDRLFKRQYPE